MKDVIQIKELVGRLIILRVLDEDFEILRFSTCGRVTAHSDPSGPPFISVGNLNCNPNLLVKRDRIGGEDSFLIEVITK